MAACLEGMHPVALTLQHMRVIAFSRESKACHTSQGWKAIKKYPTYRSNIPKLIYKEQTYCLYCIDKTLKLHTF